jgi:hypothetical protein
MVTSCLGRLAVFGGDPCELGLPWFFVTAVHWGANVEQTIINSGE